MSCHALQHVFLGMGAMGRNMAFSLSTRASLSKPVLVWNRTLETAVKAVTEINNEGGNVENILTLTDAIKHADIVWSCLYDEVAVRDVWSTTMIRDDGVCMEGKIIIECSTISPNGVEKLQDSIKSIGAKFIAMPVIGSPSMARNGKLLVLTAGDVQAIEEIKPVLVGGVAQTHIDLSGSHIAAAHKLKLCSNILQFTTLQQLAEFYVMTEKCGIDLSRGQKLVDALFPAPQQVYGPRMVAGDVFAKKYTTGALKGDNADVAMSQKIAGYVNAMASELGVELKGYNVAVENLGLINGRGDYGAIYGVVREQSGLPFSNIE